jgi:pimeloyl-ACP methyl ester carboxylesterase
VTDNAPKPTLKRRVFRTLALLAVIYAVFVVAVMIFQRSLIYFPTKLNPKIAEQMAAKEGFLPWRNKAGEIIGWNLPAAASSTGSVLVVHGNAGCALDRDYFATPIHAVAAVDVFILEYPGYGARDGSPSLPSLLAAAEEGFNIISNRGPIFLVSESIGAGVASHLAREHGQQIRGMILFAPYNRFAAVAQKKMPILPVTLLLRDRYDPAGWLKNYRGPVMFVVAGADRTIPPQFGRALYDGYAGPKQLEIIANADHNDIEEQPAGWWRGVFSFWRQNGQADPGSKGTGR